MPLKSIPALLILMFIWSQYSRAQEAVTATPVDEMAANLWEQVMLYPQEKIHVHTDKPNYLVGERIWLRAHIVDAQFHRQANASRYVYAELIDPLDSVVCRVRIRPDSSGFFHGYLPVGDGLAEGNYTLRAYTRYLENLGEEYFFRKTVPVIDPLSTGFDIAVEALADQGRKSTVSLTFLDSYTREPFCPGGLAVRLGRGAEESLKFRSDSTAQFTFNTPAEGQPRVLSLRFNHRGKIFRKFLYLPPAADQYHVTFHPEGGNLLAGTENVVAFKAIDAAGRSKELTGTVVDGNGNTVARFATAYLGMGSFNFVPEAGQQYYAVCTDPTGVEKSFELPAALENYAGLRLTQGDDDLYVAVNTTPGFDPGCELYLIGLMRGLPIYGQPWDFTFEDVYFEKSSFPAGLYQFLLVDGDRNIISERLYFSHRPDEQPAVSFTTDRENYGARELVSSALEVAAGDGAPLSGSFSVAVTDDRDVTPDSLSTIVSTLLLTSELRGHIESPGYYFTLPPRQAAAGLDLLVTTQGWTRYDISGALRGQPQRAAIEPETSQSITGKADGALGPVKEGIVTMVVLNDEFTEAHFGETDQQGRFGIRGFEYPEQTRYILQARTKKDRSYVFLEVDDQDPYPAVSSRLPQYDYIKTGISPDYIAKADQKYLHEHGMRIVNMEEITVTAKRRAPTQSKFYSPVSSSRVYTEEDIESMNLVHMGSLLQRMGLNVSGNSVQIRGATPLIVVDDIPYEDGTYNVLSMNVGDVKDIFVMKDASAMIFGPKAAGGAIVITTKRGNMPGNEISRNISDLIEPLGYQLPVEFYSPRYDTAAAGHEPDLRTTIWWKPDVTLDGAGQAAFDFYTADFPASYSVVIEGVTDDGIPVRKVSRIQRTRE